MAYLMNSLKSSIGMTTYSSSVLLSPLRIVVSHCDTRLLWFNCRFEDFLRMSFSIVSALIDPLI